MECTEAELLTWALTTVGYMKTVHPKNTRKGDVDPGSCPIDSTLMNEPSENTTYREGTF